MDVLDLRSALMAEILLDIATGSFGSFEMELWKDPSGDEADVV